MISSFFVMKEDSMSVCQCQTGERWIDFIEQPLHRIVPNVVRISISAFGRRTNSGTRSHETNLETRHRSYVLGYFQ